ncbi:hypothetical protein ACFQ36_08625 [Arthrobacter sp. GCM10027362]|uniref:hypothetical protein n=1 Tax=Arthrobacter sp. GCM10027362 TaxID=3273379 RepID=UPI0036341968
MQRIRDYEHDLFPAEAVVSVVNRPAQQAKPGRVDVLGAGKIDPDADAGDQGPGPVDQWMEGPLIDFGEASGNNYVYVFLFQIDLEEN